MKSIKLSRAMAGGKVLVRTGRKVNGQINLKFRHPGTRDRLISPYAVQDQLKDESYTDLSAIYSMEQLSNSNLSDLIATGDLELKAV